MYTNRREILDDFLAWTTEANDALARDLAERALNRALLAIWMKAPWSQFRNQVPYEFTSVPGVRDYVMPHYFGRMAERDGRIRNLSTGNWLYPLARTTMHEQDPIAGTSLEVPSTSTHWLMDATIGVSVQPATTGEACEVVSSDPADLEIRAYVEGIDLNGRLTRQQVTLTGGGAVPVGTWTRLERFGKSYPAGITPATELTSSRGTVTLQTTTGTVLQALLPDEVGVDLRVLTLYPTPLLPERYAVPFCRPVRRLLYDADPLPADWGNALFEELQVSWHVNKGELASDAQVPRPHLADLLAQENASRVPITKQRGQYR
jgi:hypothetical protein